MYSYLYSLSQEPHDDTVDLDHGVITYSYKIW